MKVSIIVPVYNAEKYLVKCLDSLVNQTYKNCEIILINDGSIDNSLSIIKDYQKKYSNIKLINQSNKGQGQARNVGMKTATGDYIMFVDSDDYVSESIVEELVNKIGDNDVIVCDILKINNGKEFYFSNYSEFGENYINLMLSHPGVFAKLYKRNVIENEIFLENVYYEDLSFTPMVALNAKKVLYLKKALYYYVVHENSTMHKKVFNEKIDDIFKVIDFLKRKLKKYEDELEYLVIEHLLYSASLRFSGYPEGKTRIKKIRKIMEEYPNWQDNKYYKKKSLKFKIITKIAYGNHYYLLKILNKIKNRM